MSESHPQNIEDDPPMISNNEPFDKGGPLQDRSELTGRSFV